MSTRTVLSVLCISLFAASAQGQTVWYVDDDGDAENGCTSWKDACPELQMALRLADDGAEIRVAGGTYKPDFDVSTGKHTGDRDATFQLISGVAVRGGFLGMSAAKGEDPNAREPSAKNSCRVRSHSMGWFAPTRPGESAVLPSLVAVDVLSTAWAFATAPVYSLTRSTMQTR